MKTYQFYILFLLLTQCFHYSFASVVIRESNEASLQKRDVGGQAAAKVMSKGTRAAIAAAGGVVVTAASVLGVRKFLKHREHKKEEAARNAIPEQQDQMAAQMIRRSVVEEFVDQHLERRNDIATLFKNPVGTSQVIGGGPAASAETVYEHQRFKMEPARALAEPRQKRDEFAAHGNHLTKRGAAPLSASAMLKPVVQGAGTIAKSTKTVFTNLAKQAKTGFRNLSPHAQHHLAAGAAVTAVAGGGAAAIAVDRKLSKKEHSDLAPNNMGPGGMPSMPPMKRSFDEVFLQKRNGPEDVGKLVKSTSNVGKQAAEKIGKSVKLAKFGKAAGLAAGGAAVVGAGAWLWQHINKSKKQEAPPPATYNDMPPVMQRRSLTSDQPDAQQFERRSPISTPRLLGLVGGGATIAGLSAIIGNHFGKTAGRLQTYERKPPSMSGGMGSQMWRRSLMDDVDETQAVLLRKRHVDVETPHQQPLQRRGTATVLSGLAVPTILAGLIGERIGEMRGELTANKRVGVNGMGMGMSRMYRRSLSFSEVDMTSAALQGRTMQDVEADGERLVRRNGGALDKLRKAVGGLRTKAGGVVAKTGGGGIKTMVGVAGVGLAAMGTAVAWKHMSKKSAAAPPQSEPMPMKRSLHEERMGLLQRRESTTAVRSSQSSLEKRGLHVSSFHIPALGEVSHATAAGLSAAVIATSAIVGERIGHLKGELEGTRKAVSARTGSSSMMY
jgi:hypothetical protein